jgi:sulfate-transporting ATPase
VWKREGLRVGYLAQEPALDEGKTVHGNIMDGLREKTALLERFEALSAAMGEPDADINAVSEGPGEQRGG